MRAALERLQARTTAATSGRTAIADLVPEAWIDRFAIAGTPAEVRARLERSAVAQGAQEISLILMGAAARAGAAAPIS